MARQLYQGLLKSLITLTCLAMIACGGEPSEFNDDDIPSPVLDVDENGETTEPDPGAEPVDEDIASLLPEVSAGPLQFADPNVVITLSGTAQANEGATIATIFWDQVEGPEVGIPNPDQLTNLILIPDVQIETLLRFRLTIIDSEGRVNSSTNSIVVIPPPVSARVVGEVVTEGAEVTTFTIRLQAAQANDITVDYATVDGTAIAGIDYEALAGTLVVAAGLTEAEIVVPLISGNIDAESELFSLHITLTNNDAFASASGAVVIVNNPEQDPELPEAPLLADSTPEPLTVGSVSDILMSNNGGGELTACETTDALPEGLSLSITEDGQTCQISGTPGATTEASSITITASNAGGSSQANLNLTIIDALLPPNISTPSPLNLTQGVAMTAVSLSNVGGTALSDCSVSSGSLPDGLVLALSSAAQTCELNGTPTLSGTTTLTITASNAAGSDSTELTISVATPLLAPQLEDLAAQTMTEGTAITALSFSNVGGGELTTCQDTLGNLPEGLTLAVSEDQQSCEISGTPSAPAATQIITIAATNAAGTESANVAITVAAALDVPELANPDAQVFTEGEPITALVFTNTGGGEISECIETDAEPLLPGLGLSLNISADTTTCEITGTPTAPGINNITVRATNASGNSVASVSITVQAILVAPILATPAPIVLTEGEAITPLSLSNTGGGELSQCTETGSEPLLPGIGLSLSISADLSTCELTGTPTTTLATTIDVQATNAIGSSIATLDITVNVADAPALTAPAAQIYTEDELITPLSITNTGGGEISGCSDVDNTLPLGLTVSVSRDQSTCEISGTPTETSLATTVRISVTNAAGTDTTNFAMTVVVAVPILSTIAAQTYTLYDTVPTLVITNTGGAALTECIALSPLPTGLDINVSADNINCEITGSPTEVQATNSYSIRATNASGSADLAIDFTIEDLTFTDSLVLPAVEVADLAIGLALNGGIARIDWGDGGTTSDIFNQDISLMSTEGADSRSYGTAINRQITIQFTQGLGTLTGIANLDTPYSLDIDDLANATDLRVLQFDTSLDSDVNGSLITLSTNHPQLEELFVDGFGSLSGALSELPRTLRILNIGSNHVGTVTGAISDISNAMTSLTLNNPNTVSGLISDIPPTLTNLDISGNTTINGNIEDLHPDMLSVNIQGDNTITGIFTSLINNGELSVDIGGNNTISGDLANIPSSITTLVLTGNNTLSGNIESLHSDFVQFDVQGSNTISGDLGLLTSNALTTLRVGGDNAIQVFTTPTAWSPNGMDTFELLDGAPEEGFDSPDVDNLLIFFNDTFTEASSGTISLIRPGDVGRTPSSDTAVTALQARGFVVNTIVDIPSSE